MYGLHFWHYYSVRSISKYWITIPQLLIAYNTIQVIHTSIQRVDIYLPLYIISLVSSCILYYCTRSLISSAGSRSDYDTLPIVIYRHDLLDMYINTDIEGTDAMNHPEQEPEGAYQRLSSSNSLSSMASVPSITPNTLHNYKRRYLEWKQQWLKGVERLQLLYSNMKKVSTPHSSQLVIKVMMKLYAFHTQDGAATSVIGATATTGGKEGSGGTYSKVGEKSPLLPSGTTRLLTATPTPTPKARLVSYHTPTHHSHSPRHPHSHSLSHSHTPARSESAIKIDWNHYEDVLSTLVYCYRTHRSLLMQLIPQLVILLVYGGFNRTYHERYQYVLVQVMCKESHLFAYTVYWFLSCFIPISDAPSQVVICTLLGEIRVSVEGAMGRLGSNSTCMGRIHPAVVGRRLTPSGSGSGSAFRHPLGNTSTGVGSSASTSIFHSHSRPVVHVYPIQTCKTAPALIYPSSHSHSPGLSPLTTIPNSPAVQPAIPSSSTTTAPSSSSSSSSSSYSSAPAPPLAFHCMIQFYGALVQLSRELVRYPREQRSHALRSLLLSSGIMEDYLPSSVLYAPVSLPSNPHHR